MDHLSPFAQDALLLDALSPPEADHARAHLARCDACREAASALSARRERFAREILPRTLPTIQRQLGGRRAFTWPTFKLVLAPALAAAAALLIALPLVHRSSPIGVKGDAAMQVVARRGEAVTLIQDGARLAPGDALRFVVEPTGHPYLLVASIDGDGKVSVYFPFGEARSGEVHGERVELPGSVVLDRAPGPERIFAVLTSQPITADEVAPALRALGARGAQAIRETHTLALAIDGAAQASFLLEKDVP